MKRAGIVISVLLSCYLSFSQHLVRIELREIPSPTPGDTMYVAGSFNGWNPKDAGTMFRKDGKGTWFTDLTLAPGNYEFKLTRGSWNMAECSKDGSDIGNRQLIVDRNTMYEIIVEGWKDRSASKQKQHTASANVRVIDTAFYIPQLNRKRRIWVYLPSSYPTDVPYPVLYMQDGQNVFDAATSFAGEWGVDEYLDSAFGRKCIVVGIDNGGDKRMNEYCPYDFTLNPNNPKRDKGEGREYADFLVKTLKPYIDKHYKTIKGRSGTFIAGSSMGGLISLYAVLAYPKVFGGAGIFSPSVWICRDNILALTKHNASKVKSKLFFYAGKQESGDMIPDMLKVFDQLALVSKSKMTTVIRDDGKHNETAWRKELPGFFQWIMKK
ncbi:MAG: alpha/beta hydrolase-fold protein [Chitinophagaceae bacterium]